MPYRALARTVARAVLVPLSEARTTGPALRQYLAIVRRSRVPIAAAVLLVVLRSATFACWEQAAFNSDHAIVGLMAKHLAEGRAFPLFFYGQSYMLGVEAWLAAPVFLLTGPSLLGLELPLVIVNVLVAVLLIVLLQREVGLSAWAAFAASLFFVIAPPATALRLVEANGGSVESFLYILLLWVLRQRPALFGIVLAFGFLHREFTIYGFVALLVLGFAGGRLLSRQGLRDLALAGGWSVGVWAGIQLLRLLSSPLGPGTDVSSLAAMQTNVGALQSRLCLSAAALPGRLQALWGSHFPLLFGTTPRSLGRLGIRSLSGGQGFPWLGTLMAITLAAVVGLIAVRLAASRFARPPLRGLAAGPRETAFALYLVLVGGISALAYAALSCERIAPDTLRYDLLGLVGAVGLAAAFFRVEPSRAGRGTAALVIVTWATVAGAWNGRLLSEYLWTPPPNHARLAADRLVNDGVTRARAGYWIAYRFSFLTGERLTVASDGFVRISAYQDGAPWLPRIASSPCPGGEELAGGHFYRCPAERTSDAVQGQNWK